MTFQSLRLFRAIQAVLAAATILFLSLFGIGRSKGDYSSKPKPRTYLLDIHSVAQPPLRVVHDGLEIQRHDGASAFAQTREAWRYDANHKMLQIMLSLNASNHAVIGIGQAPHSDLRRMLFDLWT